MNNGICANQGCTVLSGCKYQNYMSLIQSEASKQGVDYKMVIVTMCQESRGNPNAQNPHNDNGSFDCGLMQVNQT